MDISKLPRHQLSNDREISGRIFLQFTCLYPDKVYNRQENYDATMTIISLTRKLEAVRYHLDRYEQLEVQLADDSVKAFIEDPKVTKEAFVLIYEMEAFLFQVKSALDILVKLLCPVLGKGAKSISTFEKKGEKTITILKQYRKSKNAKKDLVDQMVDFLEKNRVGWLDELITARNDIGHYYSMKNFRFRVRKDKSGKILVKPPLFNRKHALKLLQRTYANILDFCQDFMSVAVALKAPNYFRLDERTYSESDPNYGPMAKYLRFGFRVRPDKLHLFES